MGKKIAIIGAGISGLSAGQLFQEKGYTVVLFEKKSMPGGLVSCSKVDGVLFHKVGGHVFNSKMPEVLDWFWSKFDKNDFCSNKRIAKIYMNSKTIGYPIENYLYMFEPSTIKKVTTELLTIYKEKENSNPNNFDDFLRDKFGETLYNMYFKPYNEKIWRTDLKNIPLKWLEGKLPMPNIPEILVSNIVGEEESNMVHSSFWYPKNGGSQFIANTLAEGLKIKYNQSISTIEKIGDKWLVEGETFDKIIYTCDIRNLQTVISDKELPVKVKNLLPELQSNGTSNLLCEIDEINYSWMYFPENKYKIHRMIFTGNFAKSNNGNSPRPTCTIEYSGYLSKEILTRETEKLPFSPKVLAYNYEPNSYIYMTHNTQTIVSTVKECLESQSFYLIGRFAEWKYYNMDNAIKAGMDLLEKLK
jgi:protoporphyrinogen oxidase